MVKWETTTIGTEFDLFAGGDVDREHFSETRTNVFKYPIYANALQREGLYGFTSNPRYKGDSITITGRGDVGVPMYRDTDFDAIVRLLVLTPKSNRKADSRFTVYLIERCVDFPMESTGVPQLTIPQIRDVELILPPLPEQRRITAVLSDTDELIVALEKLIAKKRNIKLGAMQELLTGKRRRPGFSGEWETKQLGKIALDIKTGKRNNEDKVNNGKYPFFVRSQQIERINEFSYDCEAVLVPGEGNIGQIFHYVNGKFDCHQRVYKISNFVDADAKFIFYYLKMFFGQYALMNTVKATVDSLRLPTFMNYEMFIPQDIREQTAIASILSDMDAEMDALTAKLSKLKHIKQGMMSELLTGKIRLLQPEESIEIVKKTKIKTTKIAPISVTSKKKGHNQQFDDAVAFAEIVDKFYNPKYRLGRVRMYKLLYLFRRYQESNMEGFKKMAAGPYKSDARYKGGEKIAIKNGYIVETKGDGGFIVSKGKNITQAFKYTEALQGSIKWLVSQFLYKSRNELETLATVDMAISELQDAGKKPDLASVKEVINSNSEWKPKLSKPHFSDENIISAIKWSNDLFGQEAKPQ